jgi:hypothetical protein
MHKTDPIAPTCEFQILFNSNLNPGVLHNLVISFVTQDSRYAKDEAVREQENKINS